MGRVVAHHRLVAQSLDEGARDLRRDRRDQVDPVRRERRREHGHRLQVPRETAGVGIAEHHLAVGEHVGAADLHHSSRARGRLEGGDQVLEEVVDGDGLHAREHPLRADHHRQTLGEVADHLERDAAGADHHGGAELGDRHAGLAQRLAGLLARAQVLREVGGGVAEAAQVDDAAHAGRRRRRGRRPSPPRGHARGTPRPSPWSARGSRPRRRRARLLPVSPAAARRRWPRPRGAPSHAPAGAPGRARARAPAGRPRAASAPGARRRSRWTR